MYSNTMGKGFRWTGMLTVFGFVVMVIISIESPQFPVACLEFKVEGHFDITSLSIAAIIMILYNLFTWV